MEYKYITIEDDGTSYSGKTCRWVVRNNKSGDELGSIDWYSHWRQYIFNPNRMTMYSAGCLLDITDFLLKNRKTRP